MFDKYHLIHFEIKKSLTDNSNGLISVIDEINGAPQNSTVRWAEFANDSNDTNRSVYCWTGSFDMLLPAIVGQCSTETLYLQSFCIMNNTKESFISVCS